MCRKSIRLGGAAPHRPVGGGAPPGGPVLRPKALDRESRKVRRWKLLGLRREALPLGATPARPYRDGCSHTLGDLLALPRGHAGHDRGRRGSKCRSTPEAK